jgi:hypothetical protein
MSEHTIRTYLQEKHFSAGTAERWLAKPPEDRRALLNVALRLRLGENHFRDVLDAVEDIACRRRSGLSAVLESEPVAEVFSKKLSRNEALKAFKQVLRRLRYPQLTEMENRMFALVKQMRLPPGVAVEFPKNLEGEEVFIALRAASGAELRTKAAAFAEAAAKAEWDEIFALLGGDW